MQTERKLNDLRRYFNVLHSEKKRVTMPREKVNLTGGHTMIRTLTTIVAAGSLLWLAGCGNEVLDKQSSERSDVQEELRGQWNALCSNKQTQTVVITESRVDFTETTYFDAECKEKVRSVVQGGTYSLANNYKTGIPNSIVIVADEDVKVTLYSEEEVDSNNNVLVQVNNEKQAEINPTAPISEKKRVMRENLRIVEARKLTQWVVGDAGVKVLNRLQLEKLGKALSVNPFVEQNSRTSVRYETDNGFLQLAGPGSFGRVYARQ